MQARSMGHGKLYGTYAFVGILSIGIKSLHGLMIIRKRTKLIL